MANGDDFAGGAYQTVGWVFKAKDMASGVVAKTSKSIAVTGKAIKSVLWDVAEETDSFATKTARAIATVSGIRAVTRVVGDLGKAVITPLVKAVVNVSDFAGHITDSFDRAGAAVKEFFTKERTFVGMLGKIASAGRSAGAAVGEMAQKFITIEKITEGIKSMGGLAGVLLGPLAPILRLFSPLIDMVVKQFAPAIETFAALVENSFGPFSMVLEIIAQNLARKIQPLIAPFVSFLEIAAVQIGNMMVSFLEGEQAKKFLDSMVQVFTMLLETGLKVAPVLLKAFVDLAAALLPLVPALTKIAMLLVEKILAPTVVKLAETLAEILDKHVIPFINEWLPVVEKWIDGFGKSIEGFDIVKWIGTKIDWLKTEVTKFIDWVFESGGAVKDRTVTEFLKRLGKIALAALKEVLTDLAVVIKKGMDGGVAWLSKKIGDLATDIWTSLDEIPGGPFIKKVMEMLSSGAGKVATGLGFLAEQAGGLLGFQEGATFPARSPVVGMIGEGPTPEIAMPLTSRAIEQVLPPIAPRLNLPGLDEVAEILRRIDIKLGGTLTVEGINGEGSSVGEDDLGLAIGTGGMTAW